MLESIIDLKALLKPIFIADVILLPFPSSSLILSNISTLASTAIPTVNKNAAIPGKVRVTPTNANI